VKNLHIATVRVAGTDRQGTSLAAYKLIDGNWYKNSGAKDLIIASGANYADALSISPYSYRVGAPIVLTKADGTLTDEAIEEIAKNKYIERVIILGGKDSVKSSVVDAIDKFDKYGRRNFEFVRLGGENRYKTSALIAEWEVKEWYANNAWGEFSFDTCYVATGENYPDALVGGQLAGGYWNADYKPAPLLLTKDGDTTAESLIKSEIDDSDFVDSRVDVIIDEKSYNYYLASDNVYGNDDPYYIYADAWYGTENTYYIPARALVPNWDESANTTSTDWWDQFFGTNVLWVDALKICGGDWSLTSGADTDNGGVIFRDLGYLGDNDFYGYILGGTNSVSKDKAKSLDKAVADSLDDKDLQVSTQPTDDDDYFTVEYSEAKQFSSLGDFYTSKKPGDNRRVFKIEYDSKVNGIDRWIVKIPYGSKWKRVEGVYAYAHPKDAYYDYLTGTFVETNDGTRCPVKVTDWLIVGETYNVNVDQDIPDYFRVIFNNKD
jgi:hypothetical protein